MKLIKSSVAFLIALLYANQAMAQTLADFAGTYNGSFAINHPALPPFADKVVCRIPKTSANTVGINCTLKTHNQKLQGVAEFTDGALRFTFAPADFNEALSEEFEKFLPSSGPAPIVTSPVQFFLEPGSNRADGLVTSTEIPIDTSTKAFAEGDTTGKPKIMFQLLTAGFVMSAAGTGFAIYCIGAAVAGSRCID